MELAIANSAAYCPPEILVRWLSGRKQRFAKAPYLSKGTEGSNPSLTAMLHVRKSMIPVNIARVPLTEIRTLFDRWGALRAGVRSEAPELEPKRGFG
jgi:hypothetical protein